MSSESLRSRMVKFDWQAECLAVAAQDGVGERVERSTGDPIAAPVEQQAGAPQHLAGGLAREGEQQNLAGIDSRFDEAGDAKDQGARLSGAGAGDDEDRPLGGDHGVVLGWIQLLAVVDAEVVVASSAEVAAENVLVGIRGHAQRTLDGQGTRVLHRSTGC